MVLAICRSPAPFIASMQARVVASGRPGELCGWKQADGRASPRSLTKVRDCKSPEARQTLAAAARSFYLLTISIDGFVFPCAPALRASNCAHCLRSRSLFQRARYTRSAAKALARRKSPWGRPCSPAIRQTARIRMTLKTRRVTRMKIPRTSSKREPPKPGYPAVSLDETGPVRYETEKTTPSDHQVAAREVPLRGYSLRPRCPVSQRLDLLALLSCLSLDAST